MKSRIIKAIYEGIDKALILFDDEISDFNKSSKVDTSNHERIIANMIIDECIEKGSMTIELYNQIVKDAYYQVKDKEQLQQLCEIAMTCAGPECDLNWSDTSQIGDMANLFNVNRYSIFKDFNCDISQWDVSNVTDMYCVFYKCTNFNCDLSGWDVSNIINMWGMFYECKNFNSDLSRWDVSNVTSMYAMFAGCTNFNSDLSRWDLNSALYISYMFYNCPNFNSDISMWDVSNVEHMEHMFVGCNIKEEYKPKFK